MPRHCDGDNLVVCTDPGSHKACGPDGTDDVRLGRLLGNGPEIWLRMQQTLDLWELTQRGGYEGIKTLQAA